MHKIILPNGYSCEMKEGKEFTIYTPTGYFKMIGFPHDFWDSIYEYGDHSGRKWNEDGKPLTENTPEDFDFGIRQTIVGFTSAAQKVEIRKRILEVYKKVFGSN